MAEVEENHVETLKRKKTEEAASFSKSSFSFLRKCYQKEIKFPTAIGPIKLNFGVNDERRKETY